GSERRRGDHLYRSTEPVQRPDQRAEREPGQGHAAGHAGGHRGGAAGARSADQLHATSLRRRRGLYPPAGGRRSGHRRQSLPPLTASAPVPDLGASGRSTPDPARARTDRPPDTGRVPWAGPPWAGASDRARPTPESPPLSGGRARFAPP